MYEAVDGGDRNGVVGYYLALFAERLVSGYFFFSSRRRHTRLTCDWSSDVCSSDLDARNEEPMAALDPGADAVGGKICGEDRKSVVYGKSVDLGGRRIIKKKKKKKKKKIEIKSKRKKYKKKKTS